MIISLNIYNCWTCVVFCIYLRITLVLKQPARNNMYANFLFKEIS